jgi:hypothetical protein
LGIACQNRFGTVVGITAIRIFKIRFVYS